MSWIAHTYLVELAHQEQWNRDEDVEDIDEQQELRAWLDAGCGDEEVNEAHYADWLARQHTNPRNPTP